MTIRILGKACLSLVINFVIYSFTPGNASTQK